MRTNKIPNAAYPLWHPGNPIILVVALIICLSEPIIWPYCRWGQGRLQNEMTEGAFGIGGGALLRAREARARKILAFFRVGSGVLTPFLKLG